MPDETERAIEKLLRACAKRTGSPDPFKLHPAARRLLQAEVARVFPGKTGESTGLLSRLRSLSLGPKLAWSTGVLLVLGVTTWSIVSTYKPSQRERLLARNDKTTQEPLPASAPQPAPTAAPLVTLSDGRKPENKAEVSRDRTQEVALESASKREVASTGAQQPMQDMLTKDEDTSSLSQPALNTPANPSAGIAGPVMTLSSAASSMPAAGQNLSSAPARLFFEERADKAKLVENEKRQPVLTSFQWEQSGSDIRVVDQDGSVYAGSWQPAARQLNRIEQTRSVSGPTSGRGSPGLFFQVSGTNRSLGSLITFSGRLSVPTNSAGWTTLTNGFTDVSARSFQRTVGPVPMSQISGTAVIGGTQQISINAVATKP